MARILVVDDDPDVRDSIHLLLSQQGHDVHEATNGRQCEKAVEPAPPDLVILDIHMPEQEGIETIRHLRRTHPDLKILAISGGGESGFGFALKFAREFGAHATLAKPFPPDKLLATVRTLVQAMPGED